MASTKVATVPEADAEVPNPRFREDHLVEASPADQQSLLCIERLHCPLKCPIDRHVGRAVLRLHLHAQSGFIKPQRAPSR